MPKRQVKPLEKPTRINEVWSMDFLHDQYGDGRKLKLLPIEDLFSLECLWVEVDRSISGAHLTRVFDRVIEQRGKPACIQTDNGPEFISRVLIQWVRRNGIELRQIEPGKPTQNAYIESLNGTLRYECLDAHIRRCSMQIRNPANELFCPLCHTTRPSLVGTLLDILYRFFSRLRVGH